jgi:hypothetical protein
MGNMMGARKKYRIQASTTTNTYVYCRIAARDALKKAQEQQQGWFYFAMMAGVFAAFTVEGYLNHLGQKQVRDWSELERKLGPREKLLLLRDMLHLSVDIARRPFQTLRDMLRLRDALAHGKTLTVRSDRVVADPDDETARYPQPDWKKLCSLRSVGRMVEDAEKMVRHLCFHSGSKRDPFVSPGGGSSGVEELKAEQETGVA